MVILNIVGLVLAATERWQYPRHYTGAFVLGNLLTAILMRFVKAMFHWDDTYSLIFQE